MTSDEKDRHVADLALAAAGDNRLMAAARLRLQALDWRDLAAANADNNVRMQYVHAAARRERAADIIEAERSSRDRRANPDDGNREGSGAGEVGAGDA